MEKLLHESAKDGAESFDESDNERTEGNRTERRRHRAMI